jgi:hypothetical protein
VAGCRSASAWPESTSVGQGPGTEDIALLGRDRDAIQRIR